jgi:hypothetical protein
MKKYPQPLITAIACFLFISGSASVSLFQIKADDRDVMSVDADRQKSDIENLIEKTQDLLSALKFQDARGNLDLASHKIDKSKKKISEADTKTYNDKVNDLRKKMEFKEDSLINVTYDILRSQGEDTALMFIQNTLRSNGVNEKKVKAAEKKVLKEGPALKQVREQKQIAELVIMLKNGETPPQSTDLFLLQSARRVVKKYNDSLQAAGVTKGRSTTYSQGADNINQIKNDENLSVQVNAPDEDRMADQQIKNEEKSQIATSAADDNDRTKAQEKQLNDSGTRDSIMQEEARARKAQQDQARIDSIASVRKAQEYADSQLRKKEMEQARRDSIDNYNKMQAIAEKQRKEQIALMEKNRKDSIDAFRKYQKELEKQRKAEQEIMEKHIKDSIDAEKQRQAELARNRHIQDSITAALPHGKIQNDSVEAQRWGLPGTVKQDKKLADQQEKDRINRLISEEQQKLALIARKKEQIRQDSIASQQRLLEQQRLKARRDSIETANKLKEQMELQIAAQKRAQALQEEKEKQAHLAEEKRKAVELARQKEQARRDSIEMAGKIRLEHEQQLAMKRQLELAQAEKDRQARQDSIVRQRQILQQEKLKARQDSIETARKIREQREQQRTLEKQRELAQAEKDRQVRQDSIETARKLKEQMEKTYNDSMEIVRKNAETEKQRLKQQLEQERERTMRLKEQLSQVQASQDVKNSAQQTSATSQKEMPTTPPVPAIYSTDNSNLGVTPSSYSSDEAGWNNDESTGVVTKHDEERQKQLLALQEKARQEYQKKIDEQNAQNDKQRQKFVAEQQKRAKEISADDGKGLIHVAIDDNASKYDIYNDDSSGDKQDNNSGSSVKAKKSAPSSKDNPEVKTIQESPQKILARKTACKKQIENIYILIEKNKNKEAIMQFKQNRSFIIKYADPEAFSILEQTITGISTQ